ncbi:energy transducer TonB [Polaribacter sp. ALD11]|uniref:energy transducer TonB n=1 Tax=Polaribacter sp. ALD11 TaxID=2058137 RepID=UPI000C313ABF|nr:energy transducer TonB [Polaribacter sp. ALD11]AUC85247.1 energy transducer TonB [Polaribacter sp. ALD11]
MLILDTKHKRKSAVITALILLLLIFGIFNYGMQYLDPPEEYGLAINFGDANVGSGEPVVVSKKTVPKEVVKKEAVVEEVKETPEETIKEEIITNDTSKDVPVVEKVKEKKKEPIKEVIKKEIPKEKPKPKPSKENQDALNKLLNGNSSEGKSKGEGDDEVVGVKGKKEGDPNASNYYGNTGSGSGGDYNLAGRKALSKPKKQPDCQEEGIVVVRITVDKNGKVISAVPGVKGTTNTAPCLAKPAKEAALRTTWNSDKDAPKIQIGTIIYKFSLSK